jgi:hypothetical protein
MSMTIERFALVLGLTLPAIQLGGCNKTVECGMGTVEEDGVCIGTGTPDPTHCGPGTRWNPISGECRGDLLSDDGGPPIYCGEFTDVVVNDAGIPVCVGTGEGGECDESRPITCPAPPPNRASICGRIYDTQTSTVVPEAIALNLEVRIYDPIGFVMNPTGTAPLATIYPDKCGVYKALDQIVPPSGFIAVATDDLDQDDDGVPDSGMDLFRLTGIAAAADQGQTLGDVNAFNTRIETDMMWTTTAGLTGQTFAERGVYVPIFLDPLSGDVGPFGGTPTAGVNTTQGGSTDDAKDYYFADTDPLLRGTAIPDTTPGVLDGTGVNGSGLWINGTLIMFSGVGGEPADCMWPANLAATVPGVVFVQERIATGGSCEM